MTFDELDMWLREHQARIEVMAAGAEPVGTYVRLLALRTVFVGQGATIAAAVDAAVHKYTREAARMSGGET